MPDRLPTPPSSPQQDPSKDGPRAGAGPDSESTGARRGDGADNPFAPPPDGSPDRPWQPRQPEERGKRDGRGGGSRWSSRQPGRSSGPFGQRPGDQDGQDGGPGGPGGLRWDPTDPVQRRARYALLAGMWAFFFALFSWPYVALLLGALAIYWSINSLRDRPATASGATAGKERAERPATAVTPAAPAGAQPQGGGRQQKTAAVSGLVTACLALAMVTATFTAQIVYRDYYTCVDDALTTTAQKSCEDLLPEQLRPFLGSPQN